MRCQSFRAPSQSPVTRCGSAPRVCVCVCVCVCVAVCGCVVVRPGACMHVCMGLPGVVRAASRELALCSSAFHACLRFVRLCVTG
jgi:hypothetical protein